MGSLRRIFKALIGWDKLDPEHKKKLQEKYYLQKYKIRALGFSLLSILPIPITVLLQISGSDKHQVDGHLYGFAYGRAFERFRYRRIKLLEIGIGGYGYRLGGESLLTWRAYFPFAKIMAADIEDKSALATPRVKIFKIDQGNEHDLQNLAASQGPFDIIIDDGSHLSRHQIFTFLQLFDSLLEGGLYVIEDVMTSFWDFGGWDGAPIDRESFAHTCVGFFQALVPYLNADEFQYRESIDEAKCLLAKKISWIHFEKNLILLERRTRSKGATAVERLMAAKHAGD